MSRNGPLRGCRGRGRGFYGGDGSTIVRVTARSDGFVEPPSKPAAVPNFRLSMDFEAQSKIGHQFDQMRSLIDDLVEYAQETEQKIIDLALKFGMPSKYPDVHHALIFLEEVGMELEYQKRVIDQLGYSSLEALAETVQRLSPSL